MIRAFLLGMAEFRRSFTTRCDCDVAYEAGRDFAHRITLRRFDA
jgi:hypothetical protein